MSQLLDIKKIESHLNYLEIEFIPSMSNQLLAYAQLVIEWNQRVNLTGSQTLSQFIDGPLFDALTLLPLLKKPTQMVDIGSGGGLPGIPVAICRPDLNFTLVEPRVKRTEFLKHAGETLQIDVRVVKGRHKAVPSKSWDGAVAQAVWSPIEWIRVAGRLVKKGGDIYVLSSSPITELVLPPKRQIVEQGVFIRPKDSVKRYCARVVII